MSPGAVKLRIKSIDFRFQNLRLRMPFRFGIATLTETPQMTMRLVAEDANGQRAVGYASDVLPALWFDKAPGKTIEEKVLDQVEIIALAARAYQREGTGLATPFELWWSLYPNIKARAAKLGINPLTAGFGSSFPERAMIDAACRLTGLPFFEMARRNQFGIEPGAVHEELRGFDVRSVFPERPLDRIWCRHTVGLGDPLRVSEISAEDRVEDGFPQALEEDIADYGLRYFKIKIGSDRDWNLARLIEMARLFASGCGGGYRCTLDGNEQVKDLADAAWLLAELEKREDTRELRRSILFVEQPLSRETALDRSIAPAVQELRKSCKLLIDESDDDVTAFPTARAIGYDGISCKNCKGVFKAILNKCLLANWSGSGIGPTLLSSEDLTNIGVVPLQEDFATIAALGIDHSERNGHHYFKGLAHLGENERASALRQHGDLYEERGGTTALRIRGGAIAIGSIHHAGFGYSSEIDFEHRLTLEEWRRA